MSKNKQQQKKKERERRVAKKKLAIAAKRQEQEKAKKEDSQPSGPARTKLTKEAVPKPDYVPTSKKSPFTQRRSGG